MRVAVFAVSIVLACGCKPPSDKKATAQVAPEAGPQLPIARITETTCEAAGDYSQAEVLAAVKAEAPAWQACAQRAVSPPDPTLPNDRVVWASFQFSWTLQDGKVRDKLVHSAGVSHECIDAIIGRLQTTPAFASGRVAGTVACTVGFDSR